MHHRLPRNYTLADLLAFDPIGKLHTKVADAHTQFIAAHAEDHAVFLTVIKAKSLLKEKAPVQFAALNQVDLQTKAGLHAAAAMLGVTPDDFVRANIHIKSLSRAMNAVPPRRPLIRSWKMLKERAKIADVDGTNFPETFTRPMLVLYSADWCPPCRIMRPTFARLVPFFDKADVRYCHDDAWRRGRGIAWIPQFVAYFPNGAMVSSHPGETTQQIWDTMNNLIVLGKNFRGSGELVCTDEKCQIIHIAKPLHAAVPV